jgi:hypothetical protein
MLEQIIAEQWLPRRQEGLRVWPCHRETDDVVSRTAAINFFASK